MKEQQTLDPAAVEEVMGHLVADLAATVGLQAIHLGIRVGLWKAMDGRGGLTPAEVAAAARVPEPYAREWLKHQAASGYVSYDPATERFELPAAVAAVLADDAHAGMIEGFATMLETMAGDAAVVEEAYRSGGGVGWHQRSAAHWHGTDLATRAAVIPALVPQWVPALDGVEARLRVGATVADVGCGFGAALISLAQAYPDSRFWGFDYHDGSIASARKAAAAAGVGDRVTFEVASAAEIPLAGFDLVIYIDTFHDLGDPVGALRRARQALRADGTVLLVEFAGADRLEENFTPFGRLLYGASALVCTPNAVSQGATDPLGSLPGERRLAEIATKVGFSRVRRLPVEAPVNLVMELRP